MTDAEIIEVVGGLVGAWAIGFALGWLLTAVKKALDHI